MLEHWYADATAFVIRHLYHISVAFVATLLSLYGTDVTRAIKRRTRGWYFLARASLFVLVVGFCFGALVLAATPLMKRALLLLGPRSVIPGVLIVIVTLGLLAERRRQIRASRPGGRAGPAAARWSRGSLRARCGPSPPPRRARGR